MSSLTISGRFCGPAGTGNGGYVAGRLAEVLTSGEATHRTGAARDVSASQQAAVQVTLREPPPLETPLDLHRPEGETTGITATFGGAVVAEAEFAELSSDPVAPVTFQAALAAMAEFGGLREHPFPSCFVCGTERPAPDGLGLRPGPVPGRPDTVATAWIPQSLRSDVRDVPAALVWAALDCPGGWSSDLVGRPMVLGQMTACVDALPEPGDECVIVGQRRDRHGRKTFTATTAYDSDGRILARAEAIWFDVDAARFAAP